MYMETGIVAYGRGWGNGEVGVICKTKRRNIYTLRSSRPDARNLEYNDLRVVLNEERARGRY